MHKTRTEISTLRPYLLGPLREFVLIRELTSTLNQNEKSSFFGIRPSYELGSPITGTPLSDF